MPRIFMRAVFLALALSCAVICRAGVAAAQATGPGPGTAPSGGTAAAADLSTPAKATQAFAAAMRAGDASAIRATTTGGTDSDYLMLKSWSAYVRSAEALYRAASAKFDAGADVFNTSGGLGQFEDANAIDVKGEGDAATVSPRGGRGPSLNLTKNNGNWRIDLARLPDKDQLSRGAADMRALGKVMDRIAGDITSGRYAKADDAAAALAAAMHPVLQPEENGTALAQQARSARPAVESPPKLPIAGYDPAKVDAHRQVYEWSGIPMAVELVLKLTGREPADYYDLQKEWKNKRDGNFINFDNQTVAGLTFHHRFDDPRGNEFPTEELFKTIDAELKHGRYVMIALYTGSTWGIYVIVGRTASGDYHAVTKGLRFRTLTATNVKARVREMKGTDILTYTIGDSKDAAKQPEADKTKTE